MHFIDDPADFVRVALLLLSLWCAWTLLKRFRAANRSDREWNSKTKDYWFALFVWTVVGIALPIQGILLDRPITPVFILTIAAVMVTGKGLHKRGAWGGDDH